MGRWVSGLLLLAGCAQVVAPGSGTLSDSTTAKHKQLSETARYETTLRAIATADQYPQDLRCQRKAAELVQEELKAPGDNARGRPIYEKARPLLERLEQHAEACTTRVEAGRVRAAAGDRDRAASDFVASAKDCRSVQAFLQAGWTLRELNRCSEILELAKWVWPASDREQWVPILDTVAACSNAVTLRTNLAFAPRDVVHDYFALLDQRERERERREREYEAARARAAGQWRCESSCDSAVFQCSNSCQGGSYCWSRCQALGSACRAGCF